MDIDALVDTLAFGATVPKVTSCLGMYLSPETIYISETHLEKGKVVVDHLVRIPVPAASGPAKKSDTATPATASTLNTDFLMDNAKLAELIRQSMSQISWKTKNVMVTLSHHLGLLRYFTMPAMERRYWKSAVPLEAKKYIPIPFDVLSHDFQVIPLPPDANNKPRQGALIAVTQRKNMANIESLFQELGLTLVGMEVAPCSVLRVWDSLDQTSVGKAYGQVHFDGGNIRILLADKGFPVFFRELFLGAESSLGDQRKIDLGGCVAFAQKQLSVGALAQVRVSGATAALPKWQEAFSQEVGLPTVVQDTAALLGIKGGDWGGYAAIGASLRSTQASARVLDLGRVGQVTEDERRTARALFAVSAALAVWFVVMGFSRSILYNYRAQELTKYRRDADIEAVFAGKSPEEIDLLLRGMQAQVDMMQGIGADSLRTTALIKDIVEALPEKAWLSNLSVTNPLWKGSSERSFVLQGHVVAPTVGQEQDLALEFKDRLSKAPLIGRYFPDIQVTVSGRAIPEDQTKGLDPDMLARRLEERTSFIINGRARK